METTSKLLEKKQKQIESISSLVYLVYLVSKVHRNLQLFFNLGESENKLGFNLTL